MTLEWAQRLITAIALELHLKTGAFQWALQQSLSSQTHSALLLRCRTAVKRNNINSADKLVRTSYSLFRTFGDCDLVKLLARRYQSLGLLVQAEATLKCFLSDHSTDLSLRKELIAFYVETDQWKAAETLLAGDLTALMELYSQTWQVEKVANIATSESQQRALVHLYQSLWEYEKAAEVLWRLVEKQEKKVWALKELVTFCVSKGLYSLAEKGLKAWGTAKDLSNFYISIKQYDKAEASFQVELTASPAEADIYQRLAGLYKAKGQAQQACSALRQEIAILCAKDPCSQRTVTTVRQFLTFCEKNNRFSECEEVYREQLARFQKHMPAAETNLAWERSLCDFYKRTRQFRKVEAYHLRILSHSGGKKETLEALAVLYSQDGFKQFHKEEEVRVQLRSLQPSTIENELQLADFYSRWDIKRYETAETVLRDLIERYKQTKPESLDTFTALRRLEDLYRKRMQGEKAEAVLLEALDLRRRQDPVSDQTVNLLQSLSDYYNRPSHLQLEKALAVQLEAYRIRLQKQPCATATTTLAVSVAEGYCKLGRPEAAHDLLKELREAWKTRKPVENGYLDFSKTIQTFYKAQGKESYVEHMLLETLETCDRANPELVDRALVALAQYYSSPGVNMHAKAEEIYKRLVELRQSQGESSDKELEGRQSMAAFFEQSKRPGLVDVLQSIVDLHKRRNPVSPASLEALIRLASSSDSAQAVVVYRQAMRLSRELEPGCSKYVEIAQSLAAFYVKIGQRSNAITALEEAYSEVGIEQPLSSSYVQAASLLADTHLTAGYKDSALIVLVTLISQLKCAAALSAVTVEALAKLASLYERCERWSESEVILQEICSVECRRNPRSAAYFTSLETLVKFHTKRQAMEKAESVLLTLLALRNKEDPCSDAACACRAKLVTMYVNQGRAEAAEHLLTTCASHLPGNKSPFKLLIELAVLSRDRGNYLKRDYWLRHALYKAEDSNSRRSVLVELCRGSAGEWSERLQLKLLPLEPLSGRGVQIRRLYF